jgi:type I restriction enzyme S subunit
MNKYFIKIKLGELTEIIAGGDKPKIFSENKTSLNTFPVFANAEGNNGLLGYTNLPRIIEPAVTISARGSKVGFAALRKQPFFPIVRLLTLIPQKDKLDVDFLFYNLKLNRQNGTGSGQPQITIPEISEKIISVPPLLTQQKIASVLSALDSKIELNNRINAELEAMAKTLYDYWFVQFDFPVFNKDGTLSGAEGYKSSGGKMVWNEELKREIPEGWEVKKLGNYASIKKGVLITEKTADSSGKIKVVSAGIGYSYFHSEANYPENTITISASGANAGYINFWREPIFACDCTTVRGKNTADTLQILGFLKMRQEYIYNQARGSAQPHVYPKDIEGLSFPVSPANLVNIYGELILSGNKQITINNEENQQLTELRDWLLPMLMNGQVKVDLKE